MSYLIISKKISERKSEYKNAVDSGYTGTEEEWLLSFQQPKITISSTSPIAPAVNDLWIDTS